MLILTLKMVSNRMESSQQMRSHVANQGFKEKLQLKYWIDKMVASYPSDFAYRYMVFKIFLV